MRGPNIYPLRPAEPWMQEANPCNTTDPDLWFAREKDQVATRQAKWLCATACENRQTCLDYALRHREQFGVWGAATPRERLKMRRNAAPVVDGEAA